MLSNGSLTVEYIIHYNISAFPYPWSLRLVTRSLVLSEAGSQIEIEPVEIIMSNVILLILLAAGIASCSLQQDVSRAKLAVMPEKISTQESKIINDLDSVGFENILVKNKEQLTRDYQPSSCQLVQIVHLLHHKGCQPKAIASFACSGSCPSYVRVSPAWNYVNLDRWKSHYN